MTSRNTPERQAKRLADLKAAGGMRRSIEFTPEATAALKARPAGMSATAFVCEALVKAEARIRFRKQHLVELAPVYGDDLDAQ